MLTRTILIVSISVVSGAAAIGRFRAAFGRLRARQLLSSLVSPAPTAPATELVRRCCADDDSLDCRGVLWLEHINLVVGDRAQAEAFYVDLLGFTPDPSPSFHVNLGRQQLHLSVGQAQVIAGTVGLAVPSLSTVRERIPSAATTLAGTLFAVDDTGSSLRVTCPWGNVYDVHPAAPPPPPPLAAAEEGAAVPKLVRAQAGLDAGMGVSGQPGIRYIEFHVPRGSAPRIATFYRELLGCAASEVTAADGEAEGSGCAAALVPVGPSVHLLFSERGLSEAARRAMEGVHIAVYVSDWKECYHRMDRLGLAWTNPRLHTWTRATP